MNDLNSINLSTSGRKASASPVQPMPEIDGGVASARDQVLAIDAEVSFEALKEEACRILRPMAEGVLPDDEIDRRLEFLKDSRVVPTEEFNRLGNPNAGHTSEYAVAYIVSRYDEEDGWDRYAVVEENPKRAPVETLKILLHEGVHLLGPRREVGRVVHMMDFETSSMVKGVERGFGPIKWWETPDPTDDAPYRMRLLDCIDSDDIVTFSGIRFWEAATEWVAGEALEREGLTDDDRDKLADSGDGFCEEEIIGHLINSLSDPAEGERLLKVALYEGDDSGFIQYVNSEAGSIHPTLFIQIKNYISKHAPGDHAPRSENGPYIEGAKVLIDKLLPE